MTFISRSVLDSLQILDDIFNKQSLNYRVIGSVLITAINGKPHRTLHDIDLIIDKSDISTIFSALKNNRYTILYRRILGINWYEAIHKNNLAFTFLMVGTFSESYFIVNFNRYIKLTISNSYIAPTKYTLEGITFTGIPLQSVYEGLKISNFNPKRLDDKRIVESAINNNPIHKSESLDHAFKIFIFGLEIPHLYTLFSYLYNIFGAIRVRLGKKYEVWD